MNASERIIRHFTQSQQALSDSLTALGADIELSANEMANTVHAGGKLLICGNGGSAAAAMHFSSELINKLEMQRPALAAIALNTDVATITSIANDMSYQHIFSRQIEALGRENDILIVFTTSGHSSNISLAIEMAQQLKMRVIALTGKTGGAVAEQLTPQDIELRVPNNQTTRIQEVHGLIIHCLCDLIDQQLFGELK